MKYGFVYIWYDRKHKRYYVGCHWGSENDDYICSSRWMRNSYRRRPHDFKRRTISRVFTNRNDLHEEEYRWLSMINEHDLGVKYYNLRNHHFNHWSTDPNKSISVKEKLKAADNTKGLRAHAASRKGVPLSEDRKQQISQKLKGKKRNWQPSEETRKKISENSKRLQAEGKIGMLGKHHTDESKEKISQSQTGCKNHFYGKNHTPESKEKIRQARLGRKHSVESINKMKEMAKRRGIHPNTRAASYTDEINKKRSDKLKGHKVSEETREKMRQSRLKYIQNKGLN